MNVKNMGEIIDTKAASTFGATVLTLFPQMFPGPLGYSLTGDALRRGLWSLDTVDIREYAKNKHRTVDDTPYGGGAGMVMRPDVVDAAIMAARAARPQAQLVHMSPRGVPLTQARACRLATQPMIILCGRFEAIDQRVLDKHAPCEISVGDVVLSGGELAAMVLLDACVRLLPGVLGDADSLQEESFGLDKEYAGLLEYPHYTKPPIWEGRSVPEVLQSGHHARIRAWRKQQAEHITQQRRADVWEEYKRKQSGNE